MAGWIAECFTDVHAAFVRRYRTARSEAENKYSSPPRIAKGLRYDLAAVRGDDGGQANALGTAEQVYGGGEMPRH